MFSLAIMQQAYLCIYSLIELLLKFDFGFFDPIFFFFNFIFHLQVNFQILPKQGIL